MDTTIRQRRSSYGFTIVELLVVIIVISILAGMSIITYGQWRTRVAKTSVKSDLTSAAISMRNERNFKDTYPIALPSRFTPSNDVTVTWASGDANSFCLNGVSKVNTQVKYHVTNFSDMPMEGACT